MLVYDNDVFYWIAFVVFHVLPCNVCTNPFYIWSWHWRPHKIYTDDWMHYASLLHELAYFSRHQIFHRKLRTLSAGRPEDHLLDLLSEQVLVSFQFSLHCVPSDVPIERDSLRGRHHLEWFSNWQIKKTGPFVRFDLGSTQTDSVHMKKWFESVLYGPSMFE